MKDYYYILGVNLNSSEDDIRKAYRKLSHKFHPDKNSGDRFFEERFKDINEAYKVLIDPERRKLYNGLLKRSNEEKYSNHDHDSGNEEDNYTYQDSPREATETKRDVGNANERGYNVFIGILSVGIILILVLVVRSVFKDNVWEMKRDRNSKLFEGETSMSSLDSNSKYDKVDTLGGNGSDSKALSETESDTIEYVDGDFDGDGQIERASIIPPDLDTDGMGCVGACNSTIKFTGSQIGPIVVENAIGGVLKNLGDLNGNGTDELGLIPGWMTSCWRNYHVFTFVQTWKGSRMVLAIEPFPTHCYQWEEGVKPIVVDEDNVGQVLIYYSLQLDGGEIVIKARSVKIK